MKKATWTHKVVRRMRGMQGQWFDYPAAGTFESEADAREYAETWARELGASPTSGEIDVRRRGGRTVATYKVEDYHLRVK